MPDARARTKSGVQSLLTQLDEIEAGPGGGVITFDEGRLEVSNLRKLFWPTLKLTKGDLVRHYVRVAPFILPVLEDRPLVMKRYPNGIAAAPFYQHRAPDKVPAGVRIERVNAGSEIRPHLIGGGLGTLLYTAQLGAISQDPWFSRVQTPGTIDHIAIDLDPPEGLPYRRVLDVARWVRDELKARGRRIYVDYMQNALGKTLASAYSARASEFTGVSTPLTWDEVDEGVSPRDFTVANFDQRIKSAGDPWATLRKSKGTKLSLRELRAV